VDRRRHELLPVPDGRSINTDAAVLAIGHEASTRLLGSCPTMPSMP
jgi:hypothetical protein